MMWNTLLSALTVQVDSMMWNPPTFYSRLNHTHFPSHTALSLENLCSSRTQHLCQQSCNHISASMLAYVQRLRACSQKVCEGGKKMDQMNLIVIACLRFIQDITHTLARHFRTFLSKTLTGNLSKYFPWSQIRPDVKLLNHNCSCRSSIWFTLIVLPLLTQATFFFPLLHALLYWNCFIKTTLFIMEGRNQWGRAKPDSMRQNIDFLGESESATLSQANIKTKT